MVNHLKYSQKNSFISKSMAAPVLRSDCWLSLLGAAREWVGQNQENSTPPVATMECLQQLVQIEPFFAYPGTVLMERLQDRFQEQDKTGFLRLAQAISTTIISRKYQNDPSAWDGDEEGGAPANRLPAGFTGTTSRPYFEVLSVVPHVASRWQHIIDEARAVRRPEDEFIYEVVVTGNAHDALTAILLNPEICAVVLYEGFSAQGSSENQLIAALREIIDFTTASNEAELTLNLARVIKKIRPELDIYLLSDRRVEELAGRAEASMINRIFYQVEEPLELHLSIIDGVRQRFITPFFDNLKRYAERPISTFHALPIARGKSVFKSNWIRDMGAFYGANLFLAESSATTGGLDSLLEPTGNIKKAQQLAARAFGADEVFFVTNGTSTSNKMVLQALLTPGDIVIIDRNCHKSHHYGCVLSGAEPYYVEAFPLTAYSMYGAVPLVEIKKALLTLKAEGTLARVKMVDLTNCTFDGHIYNPLRVMQECLAIKPDLVFLWDEAWFGFARWSPLLRQRTAMGAAQRLETYLASPEAQAAFEEQQTQLGKDPSDDVLLKTRLVPDPKMAKVRVYQTNSIHKSMSSLRQGSMIAVKDVFYAKVMGQFREAVFTHASTSPNLQIIATIDVARRQMELEGYGLVSNAIQIALEIRRQVNNHPLISKYFRVLSNGEMVPDAYRVSGLEDYNDDGITWNDAVRALRDDEFILDPTRLTLTCGAAGFDGTSFKNLLADKFNIQVNKTSRNSVLLQSNINNTRSDVAVLIRVLLSIASDIEDEQAKADEIYRTHFVARVKALVEDVPQLPDFSCFADKYRQDPGSIAVNGDMRRAFYDAYNEDLCEYVGLYSPDVDKRLESGTKMISANFVIPYPPGFPILVPGQMVTKEIITFMRKLDVKEVHGFDPQRGLKLLTQTSNQPA